MEEHVNIVHREFIEICETSFFLLVSAGVVVYVLPLTEMAIAHVATEYVFSDFLLKEPNQARYRSVRTELAVDKMVTCVAVGLPLLLISLAFAQEVSVGG